MKVWVLDIAYVKETVWNRTWSTHKIIGVYSSLELAREASHRVTTGTPLEWETFIDNLGDHASGLHKTMGEHTIYDGGIVSSATIHTHVIDDDVVTNLLYITAAQPVETN